MGASKEEQKRTILEILRHRCMPGNSGGSSVSFLDKGTSKQAKAAPWNKEREKQTFGVPSNRNDPDSDYVITWEAESADLVEEKLEKIRNTEGCFPIYVALNTIFNEDVSAHRDYEWYQQKAREGSKKAQGIVERAEIGLNWLVRLLPPEEYNLNVRWSKVLTMEEEKTMERRNRDIYLRHNELKETMSAKKAYNELERETGVSRRRLEQIVASQREADWLPRRERGRPKKKGAA